MRSFETEIENPIVQKDIIELAQKIELFHNGKIDEEKFRSLRLARGVYGQRQEGVQMIRIKAFHHMMRYDVVQEALQRQEKKTTRQNLN